MKKAVILIAILAALVSGVSAAERSFSIVFGAETASTNTLTNDNFLSAVSAGADYIDHVTSVVAVFPEKDAIRMSSQKTNGKFNIHLAEGAQVVASRIAVNACRYDNTRDEEASLMLNSEMLYIESVAPEDYTLYIPSRPEKTLTNLIIDADKRVYIKSITVYYDDTKGDVGPVMETVATPVITPAGGTVSVGTAAEITCATPGADIYYTVDGTEPSSAALLYTGPITISNDITLRAFAAKEGMNPSATVSAAYTVHDPGASLTAMFNFADPETLNPSVAAPATKEYVELDGRSFTDGDVAVSFAAAEGGNTHVRLYGSYDAGTDLRIYDGDVMTVRSLNPSLLISHIDVTISLSSGSADAWFMPSAGEWIWERDCWEPEDGACVESVALTSWQQSRITSMTVTLEKTMGIPGIGYDHDERAVYYDIHGRRATNPAPGFYIRLTPDKAEKVVIR